MSEANFEPIMSEELYSDEDWYMRLYQIHCDELYHEVMDQILGVFNTEAPVPLQILDKVFGSRKNIYDYQDDH